MECSSRSLRSSASLPASALANCCCVRGKSCGDAREIMAKAAREIIMAKAAQIGTESVLEVGCVARVTCSTQRSTCASSDSCFFAMIKGATVAGEHGLASERAQAQRKTQTRRRKERGGAGLIAAEQCLRLLPTLRTVRCERCCVGSVTLAKRLGHFFDLLITHPPPLRGLRPKRSILVAQLRHPCMQFVDGRDICADNATLSVSESSNMLAEGVALPARDLAA